MLASYQLLDGPAAFNVLEWLAELQRYHGQHQLLRRCGNIFKIARGHCLYLRLSHYGSYHRPGERWTRDLGHLGGLWLGQDLVHLVPDVPGIFAERLEEALLRKSDVAYPVA